MDPLLKSLAIEPRIMAMNGAMFLVTLFILDRIFWKPVMRHLDRRKASIVDAYRAVDDTRKEMDRLRAEYQQRMAEIESEARGRIQQTVRDAQAQREKMLAEARAEAEGIIQSGGKQIEAEMASTLAAMRGGLDEVALSALAKALGAPAGAAQRALVDEYIAQNVLKS